MLKKNNIITIIRFKKKKNESNVGLTDSGPEQPPGRVVAGEVAALATPNFHRLLESRKKHNEKGNVFYKNIYSYSYVASTLLKLLVKTQDSSHYSIHLVLGFDFLANLYMSIYNYSK